MPSAVPGEQRAGHGFVDQHDGSVPGTSVRAVAALAQGNPHRADIAIGHDADECDGYLPFGYVWPFSPAPQRAVAAERQGIGQAGGFDAGNFPGAAQHVVEIGVLLRLRFVLGVGIHPDRGRRSGRKPRFTSRTRTKLRINRPAPTSSTQAKAISDTTSAAANPVVAAAGVEPRLVSFNASWSAPARHLNRRGEPEDDAGQDGGEQREGQSGDVGPHALEQRDADGVETRENPRAARWQA